jgi:hypothetical protein
MDNEQIVLNGFLGNEGKASTYNFDLYPLMKDFSFYDFCDSARHIDDEEAKNHGGLLVITDKQYILTYNRGYGTGTHMGAGARIYKELHGGGDIIGDKEALSLYSKCARENLVARLIYEFVGRTSYHVPMYEGYINFDTVSLGENKEITEGMLKSFEKFYIDYGKEIALICRKFGFYVSYAYRDESGRTIMDRTPSLESLYNYLQTKVNKNIPVDENERIIGNTISNANTK